MPRVFVALPIPEALSADLAALRTDIEGFRWIGPANIHLTLRFLGETPGSRIQELAGCLTDVDFRPFPVTVEGLDTLPGPREPRVLVARVALSPELASLQAAVEHQARLAGWAADRRRFRPHLTIARLRDADGRVARRVASETDFKGRFIAHEFALYASHLQATGARYEVLQRFAATM